MSKVLKAGSQKILVGVVANRNHLTINLQVTTLAKA